MKGFTTTTAASVRAFCLLAASIFAADNVSAQETVYDVIASKPQLSFFANAIVAASFDQDSVLTDTSQTLTAFVPNNDAIRNDTSLLPNYTDHPGWDVHLQELIELHIVIGDALKRLAIFSFDGDTRLLDTAVGPIEVSKENVTVAGQAVLDAGTSASNGIVITVDGVFANGWKGVTLRERTAVTAPLLSEIVDSTGFGPELEKLTPFGATFVATADESDQSVLQQATYDTLLYNLIDENIYSQEIFPGIQYLVTPRSEAAQMWVTMDQDGHLRFNDAVATASAMAENGVFYSVDKLLKPPGIIDFLGISGFYSNLDVSNAYGLFAATTWNVSDLAASLGYAPGRKFTMFAPVDSVLTTLPLEERERLLDPVWFRHLEDLLLTWMVDGTLTQDELRGQVASTARRQLELTMLSGSTFTIDMDTVNGDLFLDGGRFFQPANLRGVDGLIQVIGTVLLPPSFEYSVTERITLDPELANFTALIDSADLGSIIDNFGPVTVFAPVDLTEYDLSSEKEAELVANHVFEGLFSTDKLLEMNGQTIKSVNDKEFLVDVTDKMVTIRGTGNYSEIAKATILKADILGSTGLYHRVGGVLHDAPLRLTNTSAATSSPTRFSASGVVMLENATEVPSNVSATEVPINVTATEVPSNETVTDVPGNETAIATPASETFNPTETLAPSNEADTFNPTETLAPSDEADTVLPTDMDSFAPTLLETTESPSNAILDVPNVTETLPLGAIGEQKDELSSLETDVPISSSNETNITAAPAMVGDDEEEMSHQPSMSPAELIDVDAETPSPTNQESPQPVNSSPTASPSASSSPSTPTAVPTETVTAPTVDRGEQVVAGNTQSDAPPRLHSFIVASTLLLAVATTLPLTETLFY